jgi:Double zinc ribbon
MTHQPTPIDQGRAPGSCPDAPTTRTAVPEGARMHCPSCGVENPEGMNFCGRCGTKLSPRCPHCDFENPPGFAFCSKCGTRQAGRAAPLQWRGAAHARPRRALPRGAQLRRGAGARHRQRPAQPDPVEVHELVSAGPTQARFWALAEQGLTPLRGAAVGARGPATACAHVTARGACGSSATESPVFQLAPDLPTTTSKTAQR